MTAHRPSRRLVIEVVNPLQDRKDYVVARQSLAVRVLAAILVLAFLAGCVQPDSPQDGPGPPSATLTSTSSPPGGGGGGNGFAIQQGTAHASNMGIDVDVAWKACEAGFCANATATNRGSNTVQVSSICESPWTDRVTHDGMEVQHREPTAMCAAYGRASFAPGDSKQADFTWDGQLHDGDKPAPAPEGSYTWTIAFWWDDANGGARQEAAADIHLIIGET